MPEAVVASASALADAVENVVAMETTQAESTTEAPVEKPPKNEKETASEAVSEAVELAAPRRSSRKTSSTVPKAAAAPPTEKKKRGPKKRTADEVNNDEEPAATSGNGAVKKSKTDTEASKDFSIGDSLPALSLQNEKGEEVNVQDLTADSGLVLFLVPKADTSGCTQQACGYRDIYPDFEAVNYKVYCLSADSPAAQSKWQTKKSLPYPLLSDPKRELVGALTGITTRTPRSHFIFEKGGKLIERKMPVKPVDSPKLALAFIKKHNGSTADAD